MEKKKIGAIALGTVAAVGVTSAAIYAYKKNLKKRIDKVDEIYDNYELSHGNSNEYDVKEKKAILKRGK